MTQHPDAKIYLVDDDASVRDALGWGGGLASPMGGRPKGMHLKTYARLMQELVNASVAAVGASDVVMERQMKLLGKIRMPK